MTDNKLFIKETQSTNNLLKELYKTLDLPEGYVVFTDFQTAGKGQPGNSWESEIGKNLLFSVLLYPYDVRIDKQFILSQITCLAIKRALDKYTGGIAIKWSNDIYWKDRKICGILIENTLMRDKIEVCVVGIGLNVNQEKFMSNAPNPVSLKQITGKEMDRDEILSEIYEELFRLYANLDSEKIQKEYFANLYRKEGYHPYIDVAADTPFTAKIETVQPDGKLILVTEKGERRGYYFKEVKVPYNSPDMGEKEQADK